MAATDRPRVNARGDVWCNHCEHYLPAHRFRRHPSRPAWWPYCRDCTRVLDRQRARCIRGTPEWAAANADRLRRQRRQDAREQADRAAFVRDGIGILRRRGLTKAEIARLARVSHASLIVWERGERRPDPNVAARFGVLLRETAALPIGAEPAYRRRLPHPAYAGLVARVGPLVAAYPVRSTWGTRKRT